MQNGMKINRRQIITALYFALRVNINITIGKINIIFLILSGNFLNDNKGMLAMASPLIK